MFNAFRTTLPLRDESRETCVRHFRLRRAGVLFAYSKALFRNVWKKTASFPFPRQRSLTYLVRFPRGAVIQGSRQHPRTSNIYTRCSDLRRTDRGCTSLYEPWIHRVRCSQSEADAHCLSAARRWWQGRCTNQTPNDWWHNNSNTMPTATSCNTESRHTLSHGKTNDEN
jgi:hypothetical protein